MPSTPDRAPSAYSSSPGRRLFNRFSSPFSNRARNIPEFEVKLDDPHKQYSPGDIVPGSVRLRVTKPTRVTHIIVRLHGYVQVYKNPGSPGDGYRAHASYLSTHRPSKSGEYFGNGFASLFEDEVVLCGDGRLAEGTYQFNFELEFPDRDLPSSIEFERGTICYMATAVMTRPTTMSPVLVTDQKVFFVERIDIAPLYPPKSRTVTLAPLTRRLRAKAQARKLVDSSEKRSRKTESNQHGSDIPRHSDASSVPSSYADGETPLSQDPSELSFESGGSSQGQTSRDGSNPLASPSTSDAAATRASASRTSLAYKVINATIESQVGGCLRGDIIPVKINISHTKPVKSFHGVIVTLYRLARVDMRPSIPLGPTEKGKNAKFEEYYPRSVTGLGGLSLSGAGSTHVFRKDLSQNIAPLYIDPQTLTTEINTKVRVPEEAFPTISTVPGQMISFKYYIEVVLDVQGRLAGSDRNMSILPSLQTNNMALDSPDTERSALTPFGPTIIDTAHIRRDKSVVACDFEVIVGTNDSERKKGKRKVEAIAGADDAAPNGYQQGQEQQQQQEEMQDQTQNPYPGYEYYDTGSYHDPRWYDYQYWYYHQHEQPIPEHPDHSHLEQEYDAPPPVPMPQLEDESQLSEKERIRRAETRLLPSQPPGAEDEQENGMLISAAPTAPYLPGESEEHASPMPWQTNGSPVASSSVRQNGDVVHLLRVPAYEEPVAGSSAAEAAMVSSTDDKQELQRQRLYAEASAPPPLDDEGPAVAPQNHATPSAPTLEQAEGFDHQEDEHDSHADALGSMSLPVYER